MKIEFLPEGTAAAAVHHPQNNEARYAVLAADFLIANSHLGIFFFHYIAGDTMATKQQLIESIFVKSLSKSC